MAGQQGDFKLFSDHHASTPIIVKIEEYNQAERGSPMKLALVIVTTAAFAVGQGGPGLAAWRETLPRIRAWEGRASEELCSLGRAHRLPFAAPVRMDQPDT
jgi:hypothetical protein